MEIYKKLFANVDQALFELNPDGTIDDVNKFAIELTGCSKKELLGKQISKIIKNNRHIQPIQDVNIFLRQCDFKEKFLILEKKDKQQLPLKCKILRFNNENNPKLLLLASLETLNSDASKRLYQTEKRYRVLFDQCPFSVFIINMNGRVVDCNKATEEIFGIKCDEIIGKNHRELGIHPENTLKIHIERFRKLLKKGSIEPIETQLKKGNGELIWVQIHSHLLNLPSEELIQTIIQNIQPRMSTENKLKKTKTKYHHLFENSPFSIALFDNRGIVLDVNLALEEFLGYRRNELISNNFLELPIYRPKTIPILKKRLAKYVNGEYPDPIELELIKRDGSIAWVKPVVSMIEIDGEKIIQVVFRDISLEKKTREQLKKSEEKYRFITENMKDMISIFDENLNLEFVNEAQEQVSGFGKEEILNKRPIDFMHPEDIPKLKKIFLKALKEGSGIGEFRMMTKNGSYKWIETLGKILTDNKSNTKFLLVSRDIDERKKLENQLKESEKKYRHLFESSPYAILLADLKGKIINRNSTSEKLFGYKTEEFIGKKFSETPVFTPEALKEIKKRFREFLKQGKIGPFEYQIYRKDGSMAWVSTQSSLIDLGDQTIIQTIVRDITREKEAEQDLRESEEKFRTIAEQSLFGIMIIRDNQLYYVNKRIKEVLDVNEEEIKKWTYYDFLELINPNDREKYQRNFKVKDFQTDLNIKPTQFRIMFKNGEELWVETFSKKIRIKSSQAVLLFIIDITEKKKAEQELKRINRLKSELLKRTSHELKTPLVAIKGYSDLLLNIHVKEAENEATFMIKEIQKGCERLENLINDILETSKLESGLIELKLRENDLSDVIFSCTKALEGLAKSRDLTINVEIHDNLVTLFEKNRMYEVMGNLLTNAIKNTMVNGKIKIRSKIFNNSYLISVKDNGIGLTEEEKDQIFKQFGKIERYGKGWNLGIEGTGLGLYISKKIIELHGGEIWVESEGRNKGATFTFTLPIRR
ncbi:MAG: PAS domain S-box protein [Candidatus Lokiarchaeota archaeon]|nr:PAS domain S-box protein [Candidatus Lokiarchaeota archaeon]